MMYNIVFYIRFIPYILAKHMNNLDWGDKTKNFEMQIHVGAFLELLSKWLFKEEQSHIMLLFTCKTILHYRDGFVFFFYLVERLLSKGAHYMESLFYCVQQINKWEAQWKK